MKTLIEPSEIRAGDTIERHWLGTVTTMPVASIHKTLAYSPEGYCMGLSLNDGETYYLLNRPKPPVDLPTEPTLGWLTLDEDFTTEPTLETVWLSADGSLLRRNENHSVPIGIVTAFTPATAVPTDALTALRAALNGPDADHQYVPASDVATFLAAVDAANEAHS